jgi:hypothetical protein
VGHVARPVSPVRARLSCHVRPLSPGHLQPVHDLVQSGQ